MLKLGLRYSYVSPLKEANKVFGAFDPAVGMVQQGQASVGSTIVKPDYEDFSPRLGFAWDVTGKGTTVVRGGASVLYSMFSTVKFMQSNQQNFGGGGGLHVIPTGACNKLVGVGQTCAGVGGQTFGGSIVLGNATIPGANLNWDPAISGSLNDGVVFPTGGTLSCTAPVGKPKGVPCNIITVDPNLKTPYVVNWDLNVQHTFGSNLSLEVGYVANHGARLTNFVDINQIDPVTGVRPYGAKFPYLKYINRTVNDGRSNYNSLQTTLTKRLSHGLNFTAGYTYGHGLDNGSLSRFGNLPQDSLNPAAEYASSDYDVRHRFTLTATYAIPGKNGYGQLLKGWKLNSTLKLESSQPWLVDDTQFDFIGTKESTGRWDFFGNPADFKSGSSSIPYCSGFDPVTGQPIPTGKKAVSCSQQSGISGLVAKLPTSLAAQCTAVAPSAKTLAAGGCFVNGGSVMVPPLPNT